MPLIKSSSKKAFSDNVSEMMHAGHPQAQALAAAYRIKREKRADGGSISDNDQPQVNVVQPPAPPTSANYTQANQDMRLNPQEQAFYQRHLTNLNGNGGVDNPDGSRSTLYQSVQEHNGKYYNVPTVWNGARETEPYTNPKTGETMDVPNQTALQNVEKAGWDTFPSYSTPDEADARYDQMHGYMEKDTADYMASKSGKKRGGAVTAAMDIARRVKRAKGGRVHVGPIIGNTGGRADKVPMDVPDGAYVIPADVVSGLGQGNTGAGMKTINKMFPSQRAKGGAVSIMAAHGETVLSPEQLKAKFGGDLKHAHAVMDHWVQHERQNIIKTMQQLPGPAQD